MTERMAFEFRRSVLERRLLGLVIVGGISAGMLVLGYMLYPGPIGSLQGFLSHFLIFGGAFGAIREFAALLAYGNPADGWHIRLTQEQFDWSAPKHAWRNETSFSMKYSEIDRIVHVIHPEDDQIRKDEYWLVPRVGKRIRLRNYSGVSLNNLFDVAAGLGLVTETRSDGF